MKRLLPFLAAILLCTSTTAQVGKFFNKDLQLSSSFVSQVYVDHQGFLWVTTRDGINRYDGYQFRVFKCENPADSTLASNYVNTIMQDSKGLFYFGMYGALQTWDGSNFHNITMKDLNGKDGHCYATCFLERRNGDVLAGTSGLGVMKFTGKETAQQIGGELADAHTVNSLLEDHNGQLWLISDKHGLVCFDGNKARKYLSEHADLYALCEDKKGNIYVGSSNSGVFRKQGEQFVHIEATGYNAVSSLYCNHSGQILIGYDGQGMAIYDPETQKLSQNPYYSMEVDLTRSKVYSMVEDNKGNLWMGLMQKGIYKQPVTTKGFHYMGYRLGPDNVIGNTMVSCIFVDSRGHTWIGTDKDGLYHISSPLDNKGGKPVVSHLKEGIPSVIMTIAEDAQGRIWIGSYQEGFGWIDAATSKYNRQAFDEDNHLIVMDIVPDKSGRLWMATMKYGVMCMDLATGKIKKYQMGSNAGGDRKVNTIVNDYASQLELSPDGKRIYVSTSMGVCCLDVETDSWVSAWGANSLMYSTPIRVCKTVGDKLWVGANNGLHCFDMKGKEIKHYTQEDGLSDNNVTSIEADKDGRLWMGTNLGMSCLNTKTGVVENYYVDDGLQSDEFGDCASYSTPDGTIIMGGTGGLTWFNPKDIVHAPWKATVQITDFFVNGMQVNTATMSGGELVTDTTVISSDLFRLSYNDNSFSIQLSTLTYDNPEHTTYLYSINGEPFIRVQKGMNVINFSHMPPGKYKFRIKAERNGQTTEERKFTVIVRSPWYRSPLAYLIYFLLAFSAVATYLLNRKRKERDMLRLQEHIHAEEMADAKLRFFINISHEIRTPMTLIVTPLQSLIKKEHDPQKKATLSTIRRNADRILGLINQMMDLRKIDKGLMQMRMRETELVAFVKDIHLLFEQQANTRQIKLLFEADAMSLPVWIDRKHFDKVIVNLLSNAFKFTHTGGEIRISITHDSSQAHISISDNGEKIPDDQMELIFKRFYQVQSNANDRNTGTGIGLDLTRSLVEMHHGTIAAHNLEKGCEFIVSLPLGCSHLKPEEIISEKETAVDTALTPEDTQEELLPEEEKKDEERKGTVGKDIIIVAEDDNEIRQYLQDELSTDYDVRACSNGREALGEVYRTNPSLIISDIMMPEIDGIALCQRLKENATTSHVPIVLLTAKNSDEDKLEGLETGADAYIVKPFNMDILRRTIINLMQSRRQLRLKYERNDYLEQKIDKVEQPKSHDDKLLERVMTTINKYLSDSDLSVDLIADEVGISRVHLHRKMKELTGQTPHDFIRNLRLKRAATLLAGQSMNVTEVMYACGFSNSTSFSTIFKRFYGMSPRDYIREHEKGASTSPDQQQ